MGDQLQEPNKATPKIKHDWYQTESQVIITVLVKNVKQEDITVTYGSHALSFGVKLPSGNDYSLELDLAHEIVPEQCLYKIVPSKVEIKLKKLEGIRWTLLEGDPKEDKCKPIPKEILAPSSNQVSAPTYPSSNPKRINWDEVEKSITKEEEGEKPEGEAALNQLFQQIYGKGSDEVKKAMNKSFLESGGTVLSTNWSDVGKRKVDCKPPDGMVFKKWD